MTETSAQKRYRTDSDFRERVLRQSRKYAHEHLDEIGKTAKIRYANRTSKQIKVRKEYLKRRRSSKK